METTERPSRDVALPAAALRGLRKALREEAGPLAAVHALHTAGYGAGSQLYDDFARTTGGASRSEGVFWTSLSHFLERRGWGSLEHSAPHGGVGLLSSGDWAEAGEDGDERQPSCAFTAGLLSSLLSQAAEGPIAVLEVSCRSRGEDRCVFAFGSEAAVHELYGLLLDGDDLDAALAKL